MSNIAQTDERENRLRKTTETMVFHSLNLNVCHVTGGTYSGNP